MGSMFFGFTSIGRSSAVANINLLQSLAPTAIPAPKAQNSPKALHNMVFGPKSLTIRVLRALRFECRSRRQRWRRMYWKPLWASCWRRRMRRAAGSLLAVVLCASCLHSPPQEIGNKKVTTKTHILHVYIQMHRYEY